MFDSEAAGNRPAMSSSLSVTSPVCITSSTNPITTTATTSVTITGSNSSTHNPALSTDKETSLNISVTNSEQANSAIFNDDVILLESSFNDLTNDQSTQSQVQIVPKKQAKKPITTSIEQIPNTQVNSDELLLLDSSNQKDIQTESVKSVSFSTVPGSFKSDNNKTLTGSTICEKNSVLLDKTAENANGQTVLFHRLTCSICMKSPKNVGFFKLSNEAIVCVGCQEFCKTSINSKQFASYECCCDPNTKSNLTSSSATKPDCNRCRFERSLQLGLVKLQMIVPTNECNSQIILTSTSVTSQSSTLSKTLHKTPALPSSSNSCRRKVITPIQINGGYTSQAQVLMSATTTATNKSLTPLQTSSVSSETSASNGTTTRILLKSIGKNGSQTWITIPVSSSSSNPGSNFVNKNNITLTKAIPKTQPVHSTFHQGLKQLTLKPGTIITTLPAKVSTASSSVYNSTNSGVITLNGLNTPVLKQNISTIEHGSTSIKPALPRGTYLLLSPVSGQLKSAPIAVKSSCRPTAIKLSNANKQNSQAKVINLLPSTAKNNAAAPIKKPIAIKPVKNHQTILIPAVNLHQNDSSNSLVKVSQPSSQLAQPVQHQPPFLLSNGVQFRPLIIQPNPSRVGVASIAKGFHTVRPMFPQVCSAGLTMPSTVVSSTSCSTSSNGSTVSMPNHNVQTVFNTKLVSSSLQSTPQQTIKLNINDFCVPTKASIDKFPQAHTLSKKRPLLPKPALPNDWNKANGYVSNSCEPPNKRKVSPINSVSTSCVPVKPQPFSLSNPSLPNIINNRIRCLAPNLSQDTKPKAMSVPNGTISSMGHFSSPQPFPTISKCPNPSKSYLNESNLHSVVQKIHRLYQETLGKSWNVNSMTVYPTGTAKFDSFCFDYKQPTNWIYNKFSVFKSDVDNYEQQFFQVLASTLETDSLERAKHQKNKSSPSNPMKELVTNLSWMLSKHKALISSSTAASNWLEILLLRTAWYSAKRHKQQQQQYSSDPKNKFVQVWLDANEELKLGLNETRATVSVFEAIQGLCETMCHLEFNEVELSLLTIWLLLKSRMQRERQQPNSQSELCTILCQCQQLIHKLLLDYHSMYYPTVKLRLMHLLLSLTDLDYVSIMFTFC